jgi:O-antigen/teichoic acid export membrane protein
MINQNISTFSENLLKIKHINFISIGLFFNKILTSISLFFIAKFYSPQEFGEFGYYMSILTILFPFSILGMENLILINKNKKKMINNFIFVHSFFIFMFLFLVIFTFFKKNYFLFLIPFNLFLMTIFDIILNYLIKNKKFNLNLFCNILFSLTTITIQLSSILFFNKNVFYLIVGFIIGYLLPLIFLFFKKEAFFSLKVDKIFFYYKKFILKHKQYIFMYLTLTTLDCLIQFVPFFYIKNIFSFEDLGAYFLCNKIFYLPIAMIGMSLSKYFLIEMNNNIILKNIYFFIKLSLSLTILIYGSLFIFNKVGLFVYFLGQQWIDLEYLINISIIKFIFEFFTFPFIGIFIIKNKQKKLIFIKMLFLIILILCCFFLKELDFVDNVVWLNGLTTLFYITILCFCIYLLSKRKTCI